MAVQDQLYQWKEAIEENLPSLSAPQAFVLALWSLGIALTASCSTSLLALFWSQIRAQPDNTLRQRLREFYQEADKKRGKKRQTLVVSALFASLLRWVLTSWHGERLALALDATTLSDRFVILSVSVLWGRCAVPVAWKVLPGNQKGQWKEPWLELLAGLSGAVPTRMVVLVMADRGLYAQWLYRAIQKQGWHPFLRVNLGGTFRLRGRKRYRKLGSLCPVGAQRVYTGTAFQAGAALECQLVCCWKAGCKDPWLILTDLPLGQASASWYRYRTWIEQGFKVLKSGGWNWQKTQIAEPERAERIWLALAVATRLTLPLGQEEEDEAPSGAYRRTQRGRIRLLAALLQGETVAQGDFFPMEWEEPPPIRKGKHPPKCPEPPQKTKYLPQ